VKDSGALPGHILHMVLEASKKSSSPRAEQSRLINKLFDGPDHKGRYSLRADKAEFARYKEDFERNYGREEPVYLLMLMQAS
jgi:hypothetical protein